MSGFAHLPHCTIRISVGDIERSFSLSCDNDLVDNRWCCEVPGPGNAVIIAPTLRAILDILFSFQVIENEIMTVMFPSQETTNERTPPESNPH